MEHNGDIGVVAFERSREFVCPSDVDVLDDAGKLLEKRRDHIVACSGDEAEPESERYRPLMSGGCLVELCCHASVEVGSFAGMPHDNLSGGGDAGSGGASLEQCCAQAAFGCGHGALDRGGSDAQGASGCAY